MELAVRVNDSVKAFQAIQSRLCFESTSIKPLLFISIDLEYNTREITQLGVSKFVSTFLCTHTVQRSISNEYPISSHLYSTKVCRYRARRRKPSHFGSQHLLVPNELQSVLRGVFAQQEDQADPKEIVLVGHSILSDLNIIKKFSGLDICTEFPSVKAILDTQRVAHFVLNPPNRLGLKDLLKMLELKYTGLHNAAHDSRYALRALLLMFHKAAQQQKHLAATISTLEVETERWSWQILKQRLELVEAVARFHEPRKPIMWCEHSPRVKFEGNSDLLDRTEEVDHSDCDGLLADIFETS